MGPGLQRLMRDLAAALKQRRQQHLYRRRRVVEGPQGPRLTVDGRPMLAFCSNDYLGLASHPGVRQAFQRGLDRYGAGSGAAHLICGHSRAHHALEEELADFTGRPRALLFSTGYMANLGVAGALLGRGDAVFEDRLNHASLLDAGLLSGARFRRYAHADADALAHALEQAAGQDRAMLVMTDGVFSMDGDLAPLPRLAEVSARHGAWLMVDDAHGLGVLGRGGRGSLDHFALDGEAVPVLMGTLGKAFGTAGAFVAGSEDLIETLIQQARSYIYTTALPPALAEATRAALRIVREADDRREHLRGLVSAFRQGAAALGLELMSSQTPIQPLLTGGNAQTLAFAEALERRGILVGAIRPPTVPEGSARLRITFSAAHTVADLQRLLSALAEVAEEIPLRPAADG